MRGGWRSTVFADLITDDPANGCAADRAKHPAPGDRCPGYAANASTNGGAFFTLRHIVPGRAACCGEGKKADGDDMLKRSGFHVFPLLIKTGSACLIMDVSYGRYEARMD